MFSEIYFLCKITNYEIFNEYFPENKVQPYWEYYPKQGIIKIDLDVIDFDSMKYEDLIINASNLDLEFFKEFSKTFIHVKLDNKVVIYSENDIINKFDFDNELKYI